MISFNDYTEVETQRMIVSISDDYLFIDNKVYHLEDSMALYFNLDYYITSAVLDGGFLLYSTDSSVVLFDLTTHHSCSDPSHKHLESEIILYRGLHPAIAVHLSSYACVYSQGNYILYSLDGSIKFRFSCEIPNDSCIYSDFLVLSYDNHLLFTLIGNPENFKVVDYEKPLIAKGSRALIASQGRVVELSGYLVVDYGKRDAINLYCVELKVFLAFSSGVEAYFEGEVMEKVGFDEQIWRCWFSQGFFVAVQRGGYAKIMRIGYEEYLSDFEDEVEEEDEGFKEDNEELMRDIEVVYGNAEMRDSEIWKKSAEGIEIDNSAVVNVPLSSDLNVVMAFEPSSNLLNNFKANSKKPQKKSKIPDKPVTFHKKIKSSGYGSQQKQLKKGKNLLAQQKQYPIHDSPPSKPIDDLSLLNLHNGPIFNISYHKDGTRLASCGGDSAAYILKLPTSKYKGDRIALVGHEFQVNSISWSSDCTYSLTTSNKYCAKLWKINGPKPGECLMSLPGNFSDGKFYYVDKFISIISGSEISLNRYKLRDPFYKDDVKRLQSKCCYKEILRFQHSSAQAVSKIACHNSFHSHLILAAGTNKSVAVWDIDKQTEVHCIGTIHRKPIHTLRFFAGSEFCEVDNDSLNLFWTAGSDNCLCLYDLRSGIQVGDFSGHTNTALDLGAAVSPCKQYIASGSEDKSAYIWDLRTFKLINRLKGFKDATNDIAWNPSFPQLCVAGNEGCVKFFQIN